MGSPTLSRMQMNSPHDTRHPAVTPAGAGGSHGPDGGCHGAEPGSHDACAGERPGAVHGRGVQPRANPRMTRSGPMDTVVCAGVIVVCSCKQLCASNSVFSPSIVVYDFLAP